MPAWAASAGVAEQNYPPEEKAGKAGRRMEKAKELTTEAKEEVKEAAAKVIPKVQSVSLRETVCGEGFEEKRGWRRIAALLGGTNSPFCR